MVFFFDLKIRLEVWFILYNFCFLKLQHKSELKIKQKRSFTFVNSKNLVDEFFVLSDTKNRTK